MKKTLALTISLLAILAGCASDPASVNTNAGNTEVQKINENTEAVVNNNEDQKSGETILEETELSQEVIDWLGDNSIDVDSNSFEIIDESFAKDSNSVYYKRSYRDEDNNIKHTIETLEKADPNTFQILTEHYPRILSDAHNIFFLNYNGNYTILNQINSDAFEVVQEGGGILGKDDANYLLHSSNDSGYIVVTQTEFTELDTTYAKDSKYVYVDSGYGDVQYSILNEADPDTFEVLGNGYARDKNAAYASHILYEGRDIIRLPEADVDTFEVLTRWIAKDKNAIYNNGIKYTALDVDVSSFQSYEGSEDLYHDTDYVYVFRANSGARLDGIDPESLEIISEYGSRAGIWWKDDNGVYILIMEEINEFLGQYLLSYGKLNVDPTTFSDLVPEDCEDVEDVEDCKEYDRFYSYKDKDGSYGFSSSKIITHTEGLITHQVLK